MSITIDLYITFDLIDKCVTICYECTDMFLAILLTDTLGNCFLLQSGHAVITWSITIRL